MINDYRTMDTTYTESVWWAFKTLHDKGLVYEGFKSMHLCPRCETTLSNFEVNQGYKDITDISVYVRLELLGSSFHVPTYIIVWTTTPWTLPANMFAAVHRDIWYIQVFDKTTKEYYILAEQCLPKYYKSADEYVEVTMMK